VSHQRQGCPDTSRASDRAATQRRRPADVTATTGAIGSATQELYSPAIEAVCSFDGKPGMDISVLEEMLPDPWGTIQALIENIAP
jgi:hypothetical protein